MNKTITKDYTKEVEQLFQLGAHLGHKKNRLHPQARRYIYKIVNSVSIIDLTQTVQNLQTGKNELLSAGKEGKLLLVVASKKIGSQYVSEICDKNEIPAVTTKWLPGLLTNYDTIVKNVKKLRDLKQQKEAGEWEKFVKHEQVQLDKKLSRLDKFYGGLLHLTRKPDILLVLDIKKEKNAVNEAKKNKLPVIAVVDTNSDPNQVEYPIVANDDSPAVVQHIMKDLIGAFIEGKKKYTEKAEKEAKKSE